MRFIEVITTKFATFPRLEAWLVGLGLGFVCIGIVAGIVFVDHHQQRFYPNIRINGIEVGGLTQSEALEILEEQAPELSPTTLTLTAGDVALASSSANLGLHHTYDSVLAQAMVYAKEGSYVRRFIQLLKLTTKPLELNSTIAYEPEKVAAMIDALKAEVDELDEPPTAALNTTGVASSLSVTPGKEGKIVDATTTAEKVQQQAAPQDVTLEAVVTPTGTHLTDEQLAQAKVEAEKLVGTSLVFTHPDKTLQLNDQKLIALMAFPDGVNQTELTKQLNQWQTEVTREPQDAEFEYDPETLKVTTFVPHLNGLQLNTEHTQTQITDFIAQARQSAEELEETTSVELHLSVKKPKTTLADLNDLGINERIGIGDSEYDHSIPSRIHNVSLTSTRINNLIIKPGEEFSFNRALGDVSAATGFQPAYIIKNGQTVLGDGGGVCQVSTTLFRAALNAGLNITRRLPHSYRVSYYELNSKPGIDATVYSGNVDLRFVNDTDHHILIRSQADSKNLYMFIELYGTSDGRTAEILDHKTWGYQPAPPSVYIPDATLAPGQLKQIDWAATGIKASFVYKVTDKDGNIMKEQTFTSNYMPWSAKYLRGEQT